jgi:predicted CoA-binding protein
MNPKAESPSAAAPGSAGPPSDQAIAELLRSAHTIAVVGLSPKPFRASYGVSRFLQSAGYRIIPVNPGIREVLGEKAYERLEDIPEKVDIVDVFRRSEAVPEIVDAAIRIGARAVWMQEGVADEGAAARARAAGLLVVMDTCILKEHNRLLP